MFFFKCVGHTKIYFLSFERTFECFKINTNTIQNIKTVRFDRKHKKRRGEKLKVTVTARNRRRKEILF